MLANLLLEFSLYFRLAPYIMVILNTVLSNFSFLFLSLHSLCTDSCAELNTVIFITFKLLYHNIVPRYLSHMLLSGYYLQGFFTLQGGRLGFWPSLAGYSPHISVKE